MILPATATTTTSRVAFWDAARSLLALRGLYARALPGSQIAAAMNVDRMNLKHSGLVMLSARRVEMLAQERSGQLESLAEQLTNAEQAFSSMYGEMADHPDSPRLVRLGRRNALSARAIELLCHLVLGGSDPQYSAEESTPFRLSDLREILGTVGMSYSDFLQILEALRVQGNPSWLRLEESAPFGGSPLAATIAIEPSALIVLADIDMPLSFALAMEPSPVRDLLVEEPKYEAIRGILHSSNPLRSTVPDVLTESTEIRNATIPVNRSLDSLDTTFDVDTLEMWSAQVPAPVSAPGAERPAGVVEPFRSDLEYVEAWAAFVSARGFLGERGLGSHGTDTAELEKKIQRAREEGRAVRRTIDQRMAATRAAGEWIPFAERLAERFSLDRFDVCVLMTLVGIGLVPALRDSPIYFSKNLAWLLRVTCENSREMLERRRHFVSAAPLVSSLLVRVENDDRDMLSAKTEIDGRILSMVLGEDPTTMQLADGGHLMEPLAKADEVVLDPVTDALISDMVGSHREVSRLVDRSGLGSVVRYGRSPILLFWGESGHGKTRKAHAVASELGKRVLLASHARIQRDGLMPLVRDAAICRALLLIDEAHEVFGSMFNAYRGTAGTVLSEIERFDTPIILCTTDPDKIMEPMLRRITVEVEFKAPDVAQRAKIWRLHLPRDLPLGVDVDVQLLAERHDLPGGFIKNAVFVAVRRAVARDPLAPCITHADLEEGARLQSRTKIRLKGLANTKLAKGNFRDLVTRAETCDRLREIVNVERARHVISSEWGFNDGPFTSACMSAVFHGASGTGKTLAATEIIPGELGYPVRRVSAAQMISMWVGQSAKNIEHLFGENHEQIVLVISEAEALFGRRVDGSSATDRYANHDTATLLQALERFRGLLILDTNRLGDFDDAFLRRIRYKVEFHAPGRSEREQLLRILMPTRLPLSSDVDVFALSEIEVTGAEIRNAISQAAAEAWTREGGERTVSHRDLFRALQNERHGTRRHAAIGFEFGAVSRHGVPA